MVEAGTKTSTRSGRLWRRWVPLGLVAVVVLFGAIQLVPYRTHNPPVRQEPPWDSPKTRTLAVAACFDCHSNQTSKRWYESVAPIAWWTNNHVQEGRRAVNFSTWDPANHRSGRDLAEVVTENSMPPSYYTWFGLHPEAKLSPADRAALAAGLEATYGAGAGRSDRRREGG